MFAFTVPVMMNVEENQDPVLMFIHALLHQICIEHLYCDRYAFYIQQ